MTGFPFLHPRAAPPVKSIMEMSSRWLSARDTALAHGGVDRVEQRQGCVLPQPRVRPVVHLMSGFPHALAKARGLGQGCGVSRLLGLLMHLLPQALRPLHPILIPGLN